MVSGGGDGQDPAIQGLMQAVASLNSIVAGQMCQTLFSDESISDISSLLYLFSVASLFVRPKKVTLCLLRQYSASGASSSHEPVPDYAAQQPYGHEWAAWTPPPAASDQGGHSAHAPVASEYAVGATPQFKQAPAVPPFNDQWASAYPPVAPPVFPPSPPAPMHPDPSKAVASMIELFNSLSDEAALVFTYG